MELQLVRRVLADLNKSGALAVAADVAAWEAQFRGRIVEVEAYLGNLGTTAGSTTVDVKKNTVSILTAPISIAFNAATKRVRSAALTPMAGEPNGVRFQPGDYIQIDVTAISTAPADLTVTLSIVLEDV